MMKRSPLLVLSGVALVVTVLATQHESEAAPGGNEPAPRPPGTAIPGPALDVLPSISGFNFFGGGTTKANADVNNFATEVPIRVSGVNSRTGTLVVKRNNSTILKAPFTIAAGQTKAIPLADGTGVKKACFAAQYDLELEGSGFDVKKKATVTPTCAFTSKSVNPWNLDMPDRVEERMNNHVTFNDVQALFQHVGTNPSPTVSASFYTACASVIVFKSEVRNNLKQAVSGMALKVTLNGAVVGSSTPIALAAGQSAWQTVVVKFDGEAGSYVVALADPTNSAKGAVSGSGYHVDVAHTCSLQAALTP